MKKYVLLFVLLIFCNVFAAEYFTMPPNDRQRVNIDKNWGFFRGDINGEEETHQVNKRPWIGVDLPHEMSITGEYSPDNNTTQAFQPMEIGWYRKALMLPEYYEHKKIYVVFDGVYRESDVWLNYAHIGHHQSGYTSFAYDITDYVRTGNRTPNSLRVRVDARRHEQDTYEGSGIYRHVWIVSTNKLHIDNWGTFVYATNISEKQSTINIKAQVLNDYPESKQFKLVTQIVDSKGIIVGTVSTDCSMTAGEVKEYEQKVLVQNCNLWDVDNPYQYKAYTMIQTADETLDVYETPFGIRNIEFTNNSGFFINGRHEKLQGFCAHYDFAGLGNALPDRIHFNLMAIMKQAGFNFYRSSHNPATPERLDVSDEMGIMVWDEIERKLESPEIELPLVEATITRDRNHPSVIVWSLENESPLESTHYGANIIKVGTELANQLDPTRETTFAASMPVNMRNYGENAGVSSYNYHVERADQDHIAFPHWKIGLISEYSAVRAMRGVYGTEYVPNETDSYFKFYTEEIKDMYDMCASVENYWLRIESRDYLGGGCVWSGYDARGEGFEYPFISRGDGVLDMCFEPKDHYYFFKSRYTEEPMVHVMPHWNWQKKGQIVDVWGYSNCDQVELVLNGKSLGTRGKPKAMKKWKPGEKQDIPAAHRQWSVPYEPGTLIAIGKNNGKEVCRQVVKTAGEPAKIQLTRAMEAFLPANEIPALVADGRDVVVIRAAITDKDGNVVPYAGNDVQFFVEGDEEIIAVGSGDITTLEPNHATHRKACNGYCVAIVQSTTTPDRFKIRAVSAGLESGEVTVSSVAPQAHSVELVPKPCHILPDASTDVTVKIVDKFGDQISTASNSVEIKIQGNARFENGKTNMKINTQNGAATIELQAGSHPGEITLQASAKDLIPTQVKLYID